MKIVHEEKNAMNNVNNRDSGGKCDENVEKPVHVYLFYFHRAALKFSSLIFVSVNDSFQSEQLTTIFDLVLLHLFIG